MMGRRSPQARVFAADQIYWDHVGCETIYGYLAQHREHLFGDEDFTALYGADNGRTSVPPSLAVMHAVAAGLRGGELCRGGGTSQVGSALEGGLGTGEGRSTEAEERLAGVRGQAGTARDGGSAAEEVD